jgi:hypothetical protein
MATILVGLLLIAANIGNTLFGRANWGDLTLANRMSSVLYFVGSLALVISQGINEPLVLLITGIGFLLSFGVYALGC